MGLYKLIIILIACLFLVSCSSKKPKLGPGISNSQIDSFHQNSSDSKINNSKAVHRATLRPYTVFGINYYPFIAEIGDEFRGIASWYGPDFHAKKTSNGEIYNMYAYTAAHKTLPMNTMVRVDNLDNGKAVIVRINDRGPFVSGRIIDLSNKAAHVIGMVKKGTANVKVTVLGYNGKINSSYKIFKKKLKKEIIREEKIETLKPTMINETNLKIIKNKFKIQVGAYSKIIGAKKIQNKYQKMFKNKIVSIEKVFIQDRYLFKVFIKGFTTYSQAEDFKYKNNLYNTIILKN